MANRTSKLNSKKPWYKCPWAITIVGSIVGLTVLGIVFLGVYYGCKDWDRIKASAEPIFAGLGGFSGLSVLVGTLVKCIQNKNLKEACETLDKAAAQIKEVKKKIKTDKN